jgi:hypothetical protein
MANWDKIIRLAAASDYSDAGITADRAFTLALADAKIVECAPGQSYVFEHAVAIPAGVELRLNGATISARATVLSVYSYTDKNLFTMAGNSALTGPGTLDGTNLPVPDSVYTFGNYAGVPVFVDGTQAGGKVAGLVIKNAPSGGILCNSAAAPVDFIVRDCELIGCQTSHANETSALVHLHGVTNATIEDCYASGYSWKGFNLSNATLSRMVNCTAVGGVSGHASHYINGGTQSAILDCAHDGATTGFGFKIFNAAMTNVVNFSSVNAVSGGMVQSCVSFLLDGVTIKNPVNAGLYLQSEVGHLLSGVVNRLTASRDTAATTTDKIGISINNVGNATGPIANLTVRDCRIDKFYWGIQVGTTTYAITALDIVDNQITNPNQYGIIAPMGSGSVSRNRIEAPASTLEAAISLSSGTATTNGAIEVNGNDITVTTGRNIQIGDGTHNTAWKSIGVRDNVVRGGTSLFEFTANASDVLPLITVSGNHGTGCSTYGVDLNFASITTVLRCEGNDVLNASNVPLADRLQNYSSAELRGSLAYVGSPEGVFKARVGTTYLRTDAVSTNVLFVKQTGSGNTGWVGK